MLGVAGSSSAPSRSFGIGRAEVGAARGRRIVAAAGGGGTRVEVARPGEVLADQLGSDDPIPDDQAAAGLSREERAGQDGQREGEDDTGQERQQRDAEKCRAELLEHRGEGLGAR